MISLILLTVLGTLDYTVSTESTDTNATEPPSNGGGGDFEMLLPNGNIYRIPFFPAYRQIESGLVKNITIPDPMKRGRVIGGQDAVKGQIPYHAGLILKDYGLYCGGSIYSRNIIITAAHCFFGDGKPVNINRLGVITGKTSLLVNEEFEQLRSIKKASLYPDYRIHDSAYNDIAIVHLNEPLCLNPHTQPIPITPPNFQAIGKVMIGGWGYTFPRKAAKDILVSYGYAKSLKQTEINIFNTTECLEYYAKSEFYMYSHIVEHPSTLCAGVLSGKQDACQGDSGGALACFDEANKPFLCGIISAGIGCGLPNLPSIYVNVSVFNDWILKTAGLPDTNCI